MKLARGRRADLLLGLVQEKLLDRAKGLSSKYFPRGVTVALDVTKDPYYGRSRSKFVTGSKAERGPTRFFQFLGAPLLEKTCKFPLGLKMLEKEWLKDLDKIVIKFLTEIGKSIQIGLVVLDRGFCWARVVNKLQQAGSSFVIGMKRSSGVKKVIRAIQSHGNRPGQAFSVDGLDIVVRQLTGHCWLVEGFKYGSPAGKVNLVIYRVKGKVKRNQKRKKGDREYLPFVTSEDVGPLEVLAIYGKRWRIETAFRQIKAVRGWTRTANAQVRAWLLGVAAVLYASWVERNFLVDRNSRQRGDLAQEVHETDDTAPFRPQIIQRRMRENYYQLLEALGPELC